MVKKSVKKKHIKREKTQVKKENLEMPYSRNSSDSERVLIENFIILQKVMTNLAIKFDNLSSQISKLLELFEISAKALAEKKPSRENEGKEIMMKKLDNLIEQNKTIARGLTLLHNPSNEQEQQESGQYQENEYQQQENNPSINEMMPPRPMQGGYQKSIKLIESNEEESISPPDAEKTPQEPMRRNNAPRNFY